jgi:nucleoid-associated protein YgaU
VFVPLVKHLFVEHLFDRVLTANERSYNTSNVRSYHPAPPGSLRKGFVMAMVLPKSGFVSSPRRTSAPLAPTFNGQSFGNQSFANQSFGNTVRPLRPAVSRHPVYMARRRRVVVFSVAAVLAGVAIFAVMLGRVPASASERHPVSPVTHVVQPGETLWSIAQRVHPNGDVASYVDQLVRANGGNTIRVGQQIIVP